MAPGKQMVYIGDVAREAGVSVATVSRVVANRGYPVAPATRERVLAAVSRLGYRPNSLARGLRVGRSAAIGLCATTLSNPTVVSAVEGIIHSSRLADRQVLVTTTFWDAQEEEEQLRLFLQERVAGVISFPSGAPAACYTELQEAGIPVVLINRGVPGLRAPVVRYDFAGGYAAVVEELARLGHSRIGAVLPGSGVDRERHRRAWQAAFQRLGLSVPWDLVRYGPPDLYSERQDAHGDVHAAVLSLLSLPEGLTALFAVSVTMTLAAIRAIDDAGMRVPEDVVLVGTGDRRWDLLFTPRIPSLCLDSFSLGTKAADLVAELSGKRGAERRELDVKVETRLEHFDLSRAPRPLGAASPLIS
ncbi:MAG: LacI family transcriptional regulator [Chloroflexi bacterium]|nr:LacI family transcriptional regulator [Chloroflexota bacterium]MCL5108062.1 LacI family transcriptional regulator [Chloroflexota bacterium]